MAVAAGEGIQELFKSMGVTTIINGGQTMNPSTEDILQAVKEAHAEKVIVLPNNKTFNGLQTKRLKYRKMLQLP